MIPKPKASTKKDLLKIIEGREDEVIDALLAKPFWHQGVKGNTPYKRRSDDTDGQNQGIGVLFGPDGDAHFQVWSYNLDPKTGKPNFDDGEHRFRTHFGGGRSLRVRNALIFLARAIDLDNKERPDPK